MSALLGKEIRALLPIFAACLVTLAGGYLQRRGVLVDLSTAVFIMGPAMLAGHAFGHEYSHQTLAMLLVQPIDRRRVFVVKWLVAAVMASIVTAVAALVLTPRADSMWARGSVAVLPIVGGLLVAPWLTMAARGTLGGVLAADAIFSTALIVPTLVIALARGISPDVSQQMVVTPWSAAMLAFSAVAGLLGFRRFVRLEAGDAFPRAFLLPRWTTRSPRRFRPLAALAGKELQLQHLTLMLAAAFIAGSLVLIVLQRTVTTWANAPVTALMSIYCVSLALVIGAMASAEERQIGIAEWQLIQPVSLPAQWAVKVAMTMGLSFVLAALAPVALVKLAAIPAELGLQTLLLPVLFLTAGGLYLSSLTNSGTSALVLSLPAGLALMLFFSALDNGPLAFTGRAAAPLGSPKAVAWILIPILVGFAFVNHTTRQRRIIAVAGQLAAIAVVIAVTHFLVIGSF